MLNKSQFFGHFLGLGLLLSTTHGVPATAATSAKMSSAQSYKFPQIEQPLALKLGVTVGGVALIGLELWWFMLSKSKASQTTVNSDSK
jgi:plastocyanin domain-containing protein